MVREEGRRRQGVVNGLGVGQHQGQGPVGLE